jgi:antitoxin MazE
MKVQVARWGNSSAVRLPKVVADELNLRPGSQLELTVEGGEMRLRRARRTPRERLQEMIAEAKRLGPEYEPESVDWGPDRGSEIIDDDDPR